MAGALLGRAWLTMGSRWRRSVGGHGRSSRLAGVAWEHGLQACGRRWGRKHHW